MSNESTRETAIIIPFPFNRVAGPQLTARDRADLQAWERQTRRLGYVQVTICGNDLVMICWQGSLWTLRANGEGGRGFSLARHAAPTVRFASLPDALAAIMTTAALRPTPCSPLGVCCRRG